MFGFLKRKNYEFEIDSDDKIVFLRYFGELSSSDVVNAHKKIVRSFNTIEGYNWIIDLSRSRQLFSPNQKDLFFTILKNSSDKFNNIKIAFVIGSNKQSLTVDNFLSTLSSNNINVTIKKVINIKQAHDWIIYNKT